MIMCVCVCATMCPSPKAFFSLLLLWNHSCKEKCLPLPILMHINQKYGITSHDHDRPMSFLFTLNFLFSLEQQSNSKNLSNCNCSCTLSFYSARTSKSTKIHYTYIMIHISVLLFFFFVVFFYVYYSTTTSSYNCNNYVVVFFSVWWLGFLWFSAIFAKCKMNNNNISNRWHKRGRRQSNNNNILTYFVCVATTILYEFSFVRLLYAKNSENTFS